MGADSIDFLVDWCHVRGNRDRGQLFQPVLCQARGRGPRVLLNQFLQLLFCRFNQAQFMLAETGLQFCLGQFGLIL